MRDKRAVMRNLGRVHRHLITIMHKTVVPDDDGYSHEAWVEFCQLRAEKLAMSAGRRQYLAAAAVNAEHLELFKVRYRPGITPDMQVHYDGREYDIRAVQDPDGLGCELHLVCEVRTDG